MMGVDEREAAELAFEALRPHMVDPASERSIDGWVERPERYKAIFDSRPGLSIFMIPLLKFTNPAASIPVVVVALCALLALLAVWLAAVLNLRGFGQQRIQALATMIALLLLPTGIWATTFLYEGAAMVGAMAVVLLTAMAVVRETAQLVATVLVVPVGFIALSVKSSLVAPAIVGLIAGLVLIALMVANRRRRSVLAIVLNTSALAGWVALSTAFGWPGIAESLQDKFTWQFRAPDVPDPWSRLWELILQNAGGLVEAAHLPMLGLLYVVVGGYLVRRLTWRVLFLVPFPLAALANLLIHPLTTEAERLSAIAWIPIAIGLGTATQDIWDAVLKRRRTRGTAELEPEATSKVRVS